MEIITTTEPYVGEQFNTTIQAQYRGSCSSFLPWIDDINFKFTKKNINRDWILQEDLTQLIREQQHLVISNTFHLSREELLNSVSAQETIKNELKEWPVPMDTLNDLIEKAVWDAILMVLQSVALENNILDMFVELTAEYDRTFLPDDNINSVIETSMKESDTFELDDEIDSVIEMSMEECEYGVVPAAESSIMSLKRKIIDSATNESCSICLEELSSGCEAFFMPCLHMFHGDCIGEWLRSSHYCPNCRYEMPTN